MLLYWKIPFLPNVNGVSFVCGFRGPSKLMWEPSKLMFDNIVKASSELVSYQMSLNSFRMYSLAVNTVMNYNKGQYFYLPYDACVSFVLWPKTWGGKKNSKEEKFLLAHCFRGSSHLQLASLLLDLWWGRNIMGEGHGREGCCSLHGRQGADKVPKATLPRSTSFYSAPPPASITSVLPSHYDLISRLIRWS